jgi:hypothetical protein
MKWIKLRPVEKKKGVMREGGEEGRRFSSELWK